ncbi:zinc-binding alcohol dehydrogenase family protein [Pendulispora brunnea]|uniref:Zinc-binding alcohol dehydrogenase family protein n=1 Tax=Pendulispora brunnea TaxID=2905690 RepID=A0ABZ2JVX7_9BACT
MKAAVYYKNGGPEVLQYEDVPDPVCPPDGVLIDIEVISVEGGDTIHRSMVPLPRVPNIVGYQAAGTVREVGANVKNRRVGQRVVAVLENGSHAEKVVARPEFTWIVPDGADLTPLACVPVAFGTAHEALFDLGGLTKGQKVLVHAGGSGVGLAAIQLAKAVGAVVLTTASSDDKLARLREFGADYAINYKTTSFKDEVAKAVGTVDLVVDPIGGKTLQDSVEVLKYKGRIVNLGRAGRDSGAFDPYPLWLRNGSLHGLHLLFGSASHELARFQGVISECIERVARGELRVVVDRKFALADAAQAHAHIEQRSAFGRVVMLP